MNNSDSAQDQKEEQDRYRNHAYAWPLLPWYVNGTLSAEEKQWISEHATVCLICRKELGLQAALRDSVKCQELDELMVAASFQRLSEKLQDEHVKAAQHTRQPRWVTFVSACVDELQSRLPQHFRRGYLLAALSILAVTALLGQYMGALLPLNNSFRTLSNDVTQPSLAADLRLIFADDVSAAERDAILDSAGLSIVAGPDARGLYLVSAGQDVAATALRATLEQLRADDGIIFAEFAVAPAPASQVPDQP